MVCGEFFLLCCCLGRVVYMEVDVPGFGVWACFGVVTHQGGRGWECMVACGCAVLHARESGGDGA